MEAIDFGKQSFDLIIDELKWQYGPGGPAEEVDCLDETDPDNYIDDLDETNPNSYVDELDETNPR